MAQSTPRSPAVGDIPVADLLRTLLDRTTVDILGAAISVAHHGAPLTVLLATGIADRLAEVRSAWLADAATVAVAVASPAGMLLAEDLVTVLSGLGPLAAMR
ncbi:hypothetical protein CFP75_20585 [Amycolatopsis alba DSM 44262]|uniref:Uncharacterized protein n=2 Tax=Amycolatopsis alba TaxID=76020 RepID=A0A229RQA7_AMYAL|nr:hypothetical protein CFP75_20585 [Amycolatopsis alba DSM 44262]